MPKYKWPEFGGFNFLGFVQVTNRSFYCVNHFTSCYEFFVPIFRGSKLLAYRESVFLGPVVGSHSPRP